MPVNMDAFGDKPPPTRKEQLARAFKDQLAGKSREQLLALAGASLVKPRSTSSIPKDKDGLWNYIKDTWGVEISRTPVCPDHDAPFDFIWLGFCEIVSNLFSIGPRGGGKSYMTALLMELNSRDKTGCESIVFGAVDDQSKKVYEDMISYFINRGLPEGESELAEQPTIGRTRFKNGSIVRCLPGTMAKMNGPHVPKAHLEEAELFQPGPFRESRNIATEKIVGSMRIKAQNFGTSTRKWKGGRVDKIYEEFLDARRRAIKDLGEKATEESVRELVSLLSSWYVLIFCIFEISAQVSNCRSAPENAGLPDSELCRCNIIENGKWDDGSRRTLESVCKGRLYKARGHRSYDEVVQAFMQNDRHTWEAQQECIDTEREGLYINSFARMRHGLTSFPLDIANGPVYTGTDWGTTDAAAVVWVQYLERPVLALGYDGNQRVLHKGARVVFAELYEQGKTSGELGQSTVIKEVKLANALSVSRVPIRKRWADLQGAGDRRTWAKMGLKTGKYSTRNFNEHIKEMRGLFDADRAYVVVDYDSYTGMGCPHFCDQVEAWRANDDGVEDRTLPQHCPSAGRYVFYGMHDIYQDPGALAQGVNDMPDGDAPRRAVTAPSARKHASQDGPNADMSSEDWRRSMGVGV